MKLTARFLLPFFGGFILTLSFAPHHLSLLAWISFIPLFYSLRDGKYSFLKGYIMGVSFFVSLLWWIPFSDVESTLIPQMVLGFVILVLYLSCYFGFSGMIYNKLKNMNRIYIFPFVFAGLEFIRSLSSIFGFPWGSLGYSQGNLIHLSQIASIGGIPLVTLWLVSINICIYMIIINLLINKKRIKNQLIVLSTIIILPLIYSSIVIHNGFFKKRDIIVAIIQPNISTDEKRFRSSRREYIIGEIIHKADKADIYILPETAAPYSLLHSTKTRTFFQNLAREKDALIITGMPDMEIENGNIYHFNSSVLVDSNGVQDIYRKMFLVPFVERLPFDDVIHILRKINLGQGHFSPGDKYTTFNSEFGKFPVYICYEAIFPQLIREFIKRDADFLVNITEDGWFGKTFAPYQHAQMAAFRSIEFRRSLVRSANTGISMIVDPFGRIIKKTDIFEQNTISGEIPLVKGSTIYARIGDTFGWFFLIITALIIIRRKKSDD